jgi:hypothetical protein
MVTGSVGAMLFSRPRLTNDMDIIIELYDKDIDMFVKEFSGGDYYLPDKEVIKDEIDNSGQFNIIHATSGTKVDFIIRKNNEFAFEEFSRKLKVPFAEGIEATSATPEDIIISKMRYYKMSPSEKHIDDIKSIISVMKNELDVEYVNLWTQKLLLGKIWGKCLDK